MLFNAVPLMMLAAVYVGVAAALAPNLWRQRGQTLVPDLAIALTFPAIAVAAGLLALGVLDEREPIAGRLWLSLLAIVIAIAPAALFLARWGERSRVLTGDLRAREAAELVSVRDRELEGVTAVSNELAHALDAEAIARILLPNIQALVGVEFTALASVDERGNEARGVLALAEGEEAGWWQQVVVDLRNEPSGIARAVRDLAPVAVDDVSTSTLVSPRLAQAVGARSGASIPLVSEGRVLGVLVLATTTATRVWTPEEISLAQAMAAEGALALDRVRSAGALADALERERLVAGISRRVRSELDVDALMRVATAEVGAALGVARCFIRLGEPGEELRLGAEWHVEGARPVGNLNARLPVSNLAVRERRTVAIDDVASSPELADDSLGEREVLLGLGSRAALAVPLVVFDRTIGAVAVHRTETHEWTPAEIDLIEAVARELGLALHNARLLSENARRLEQQAALLHAAQALTSELELDAVLERLVEEMTNLLRADAADCYLYDAERRVLRCAAVHGLDPALVGFEFEPERGLAGEAMRAGRPVSADDYERFELDVPSASYEGFTRALVAPMTWSGHVQGVVGVAMRDGPHGFDAADVELLEAFAGLAALALRNAESYEDRASQARIQRGFYRIASVLGEPISLEATVERGRAGCGRGVRRGCGGAADRLASRARARRRLRAAPIARRRAGRGTAGRRRGPCDGVRRAARADLARARRRRALQRRVEAAARGRRASRRCSRCPSRSLAAPRPRSRWCSSRAAACSPTTISSWRASWPARRAALSNAVACSRPSAARGRCRTSLPARAGSSRRSSSRPPSSRRSSSRRPRCSTATPRRCASSPEASSRWRRHAEHRRDRDDDSVDRVAGRGRRPVAGAGGDRRRRRGRPPARRRSVPRRRAPRLSRRPALRHRGCAARRARRLRTPPARMAVGGGRGARSPRRQRVGRALERGALPARRARARAQRRHPREHRGRDRRRRP